MIFANSPNASGSDGPLRAYALLWGPVLFWMAAIFVMSAQSVLGGIPGPPLVQAIRKSGHIFEYALLALLVGRALAGTWTLMGAASTRALWLRIWRVGVLLTTLYAATDEFHQSFVPRRGAHFEDVVLDALSATLALGIWYIVRIHRGRTDLHRMERE